MQRYDHGGDIYTNPGIDIDFSANVNPLGMPPGMRSSLLKEVDTFGRYPDPSYQALAQALALHHQVPPEQVLCGNGAADLIFRTCACLRPPLALVTAPTFSEYERAVLAYGGQVRPYLLQEDNHFDITEDILSAITKDVRLVFLCSPNNPTGRLIDIDLLQRIANHCRKQGTYLMLDECFIDFTHAPSMDAFLSQHPNLLLLRAFTKMYAMAGLRLGYMLCSDAPLLKRIAAFGATWSVSAPAQVAGLAALKEIGWAERTRALIDAERTYLMAELAALPLRVFPGAANYLLLTSEQPLYQPLLARGILVRDCGNYTGLSSRYIRIGIRTRADNRRLVAALWEVLHG